MKLTGVSLPAVRVLLAAARVSGQPLAALTLAAATRVSGVISSAA